LIISFQACALSFESLQPEFKYDYRKASGKIGYRPKHGMVQGISELFDYVSKKKWRFCREDNICKRTDL